MPAVRASVLAACTAAAIVAGTYAPVARNDFVELDDRARIVETPIPSDVLGAIAWAFSLEPNREYPQPLTWLSFALDRSLFGVDPRGYHLENAALHVLVVVLAFLLLTRCTGRPWTSMAVALAFGLHPLAVEPVAWATERNTLLAAVFALAATHAHVSAARDPRPVWKIARLVAFGLSLLAKPWLLALPVALLAFDAWPLGRARPAGGAREGATPWRELAYEKVPLLAASAVAAGIGLWLRRPATFEVGTSPDVTLRVLHAPIAVVRYLAKLAVPTDLAVFYPFPRQVDPASALAGLAAVIAITAIAYRLRHAAPSLLAGWAWFLALLAPTLGVVQRGVWPAIADRFAYLPMLGLFAGIAFALPVERLAAPARAAAGALAIALLAVLAALSRAQIATWRDTITLLTHSSRVAPNEGQYDLNLATALEGAGRLDEAERVLLGAIARLRNPAPAHHNLGHVYRAMGRDADAMEQFTRAACLRQGGGHPRCRALAPMRPMP